MCFNEEDILICGVMYQDGVKETGVSLAFTVRALDAGPVIASRRWEVDDRIKVVRVLGRKYADMDCFLN